MFFILTASRSNQKKVSLVNGAQKKKKRISSRFSFFQSAHLQTRGLQQQPLHVGRTAKSIYFASVLGDSGGDHNRDDDDDMVVIKKITVEQYSVNNLCHCHYMIFNCSEQLIRSHF